MVADGLRERTRADTARLSPLDRLERALALGDADVDALSAAQGLSRADARRTFARSRRTGRTPSVANRCDEP